MAGLAEPNVIDLVGQDADGRFLLIMVETRAWGSDAQQGSQLKEKINAYAGFIMDGGLARHYPEAAGRRVDIQLNCADSPPPDGEIPSILRHAASQLDKAGIGFRLKVLGPIH